MRRHPWSDLVSATALATIPAAGLLGTLTYTDLEPVFEECLAELGARLGLTVPGTAAPAGDHGGDSGN